MTDSFQTDHMKIIAPFDPSTDISIQNFFKTQSLYFHHSPQMGVLQLPWY